MGCEIACPYRALRPALFCGDAGGLYVSGGCRGNLIQTRFGYRCDANAQIRGRSDGYRGENGWWTLPLFLLGAPLFEECAFRLGLSFRRWQVAIGLGALAAFFVSRFAVIAGCESRLWAVPAGVVVCAGLFFTTSDGFWAARREKWICPMMWVSAVLFGLVHLFAMPGLMWVLLPYALLMCLMLFFAGCVLVYLRVNLGFWWAVGAHILINLPGVLVAIRLLTA